MYSKYSSRTTPSIAFSEFIDRCSKFVKNPPPAPQTTTASILAAEWKRLKAEWQTYVKAAKITNAMEFDEKTHKSDSERLNKVFEQHFNSEMNKSGVL
jgi:hypothetical protein